MTTPLLTTKLYIPPPRPNLVSRPRLIERLNAGLHRKLTLVSAPAGFGKTTLLSEWIHHSETRFFPKNLVSATPHLAQDKHHGQVRMNVIGIYPKMSYT